MLAQLTLAALQLYAYLCNAGQIFATINQLTGTVSFHDDPEKYVVAVAVACCGMVW